MIKRREEKLFANNKHRILLSLGNHIVIKSAATKMLAKKEFHIQNILYRKGIAPKPYIKLGRIILEKQIVGASCNDLAKIAHGLRTLHKCSVANFKKNLVENKYQEQSIDYENLVAEMLINISQKDKVFKRILAISKQFQKEFFNNKKRAVLIHGDLGRDNILCSEKGVTFLDWSDSRIDYPEQDVAQIIYKYHLDNKSINAFIDNYSDEKIDYRVVAFMILLFNLYDYIAECLNGKTNQAKLRKLERLTNEISSTMFRSAS